MNVYSSYLNFTPFNWNIQYTLSLIINEKVKQNAQKNAYKFVNTHLLYAFVSDIFNINDKHKNGTKTAVALVPLFY